MTPFATWTRITVARMVCAVVFTVCSLLLMGWWTMLYAAFGMAFAVITGHWVRRKTSPAAPSVRGLLPVPSTDVRVFDSPTPVGA